MDKEEYGLDFQKRLTFWTCVFVFFVARQAIWGFKNGYEAITQFISVHCFCH